MKSDTTYFTKKGDISFYFEYIKNTWRQAELNVIQIAVIEDAI